MKAGRVVVFIDGSNLYHCLRQEFKRTDIDIRRLVNKLVYGGAETAGMSGMSANAARTRELVRAYYYNTRGERDRDQRFYSAISWIDYLEPRFGKLLQRTTRFVCPQCGKESGVPAPVQKGVDTKLALDLVTGALRDLYDIAVLVSGDADLAEPVRLVKDSTQKYIENAFVKTGWAEDLRTVCDRKILLDKDFLADCWLPHNLPSSP